MKKIVHLFARDVVADFLHSIDAQSGTSRNFELMAALLMQRVYEEQWGGPTMIGFYMNRRYTRLLEERGSIDRALLIDALRNGVEENHQIDFVISTASEQDGLHQEFQLKRFGMRRENTTDNLITYLNAFNRRYSPTDAACLVALTEFDRIDFPKLRDGIERETFPFTALLLIGVVSEQFLVAGIFPEEGWSTYDLSEVVR